VTATLADTPSVRALLPVLLVQTQTNTWGGEVYFHLPADIALEPDARQVVAASMVCYWVEGQSLAPSFGPTPISREGEGRLVTPVNARGTS
jgi:hypothetical protein